MIRKLTNLPIIMTNPLSHHLTPNHTRLPFLNKFFFLISPHKSSTPHGLLSKTFIFSVLSVLSSNTSLSLSLSLSLWKLDLHQILSFPVSSKSYGYLIPIQKAGFNTKHKHSVIFSLSQA